MKRIIFLASLALATTVMSAPAAQAEPPVPAWARQASSLNLSPAAIVAKAPKGKPLKVVITRRTANGPVIDSAVESSAADAKRLIASAQDKGLDDRRRYGPTGPHGGHQ